MTENQAANLILFDETAGEPTLIERLTAERDAAISALADARTVRDQLQAALRAEGVETEATELGRIEAEMVVVDLRRQLDDAIREIHGRPVPRGWRRLVLRVVGRVTR